MRSIGQSSVPLPASEAWEARNKTLKALELAALSKFEVDLNWKMNGK